MPMQMGFRWYGEGNDRISLADIKQIPGVTSIVWALHHKNPGEIWQVEEIAEVKQQCDAYGFNIADGVTPLRVYEGGTVVRRVYPGGTIVIERCLRREHESGRRRFTISHECAHYIMDRAVPSAAFHREFDIERIYSQEDFKNLFSFHETLIDRMGAALLMPRFMVRNVVAMHGFSEGIPVFGDSVMRTTDKLRIKQMANTMGVSFSAFLIRLRELGCLCYRPLVEYITEEMGLGQDGGAG